MHVVLYGKFKGLHVLKLRPCLLRSALVYLHVLNSWVDENWYFPCYL